MPVRSRRAIAITLHVRRLARPLPLSLPRMLTFALGALGLVGCAGAGLGDASFEREMYRHACGRGEAQACGDRGDQLLAHEAATDDTERAVPLVMQVCAEGNARACVTIGRAYLLGQVVPRSPSTAVSFLERACAQGDVRGCLELAAALDRNEVAVSPEKMAAVGTVACTHGDPRACDRLTNGIRSGRLSATAKAP